MRSTTPWLLLGVALTAAAIALLWQVRQPRCVTLLDQTLGDRTHDRAALLAVLQWQWLADGPFPHGLARFDVCDVQHAALVRLLELQLRTVPPPIAETAGIDHVFVQVSSVSADCITVIGTPSLAEDQFDTSGGYWHMEELRFRRDGMLLQRAPCRL